MAKLNSRVLLTATLTPTIRREIIVAFSRQQW